MTTRTLRAAAVPAVPGYSVATPVHRHRSVNVQRPSDDLTSRSRITSVVACTPPIVLAPNCVRSSMKVRAMTWSQLGKHGCVRWINGQFINVQSAYRRIMGQIRRAAKGLLQTHSVYRDSHVVVRVVAARAAAANEAARGAAITTAKSLLQSKNSWPRHW